MKTRSKPACAVRGYGGGLSVISWFVFGGSASGGRRRNAEERVLVEGRRPGSTTWPFFDEAAAGASPTSAGAGLAERLDRARWSRERTSEAELPCSREAEKAKRGRHGAEGLSIGALYQDRAVSDGSGEWASAHDALLGLWRSRSWRFAVKRSLYHGARERRVTGPQGHGARRERGSGIGQTTGCSCRESVAEVGEAHLSRRHGEARGNP